ncbi:MAG: cobyrinate a,c-diamide synthase [Coriobacteriales bacterium]|jgi:cobyrinic acid a,c-diamide synthase|nr:cobyrinate a,c-diamide synthase [Coriobacteriales bacterium]
MTDRIMIAGTGSGSGKTTVTIAILAALKALNKNPVAFKCGPDYIDPMYLSKASGKRSYNLDSFLMGEPGVKYSLQHNSASHGIAVIEGVMGLYDGEGTTSKASSNHLSLITDTPVLLVINPKGSALSICATIQGFLEFEKNNICGVIFNNVSAASFGFYKQMVEESLKIRVFGYLPAVPDVQLKSRHLGLLTVAEVADIEAKIELLKTKAMECIDIEAIIATAQTAQTIECDLSFLPPANPDPQPKIYITDDEAFCFCYADNHEILRAAGAEIAFFSPLHDNRLPEDADGVVFWGGYPELFAAQLAANESMRASLNEAIKQGMPTYAESGGFIYLQESLTDSENQTYPMLGLLPGNSTMTDRLQDFGYHTLTALHDTLICPSGAKANAHFFHYMSSDAPGETFMATKRNGKSMRCIVSRTNILAGYQHLHFVGAPSFAGSLVTACSEYRKARNAKNH